MPPLAFVPNVAKSTLQWSDAQDAHLYTNLFWRYSGGPPDAAAALDLATQIYGHMAASASDWGPQVNLTGVRFVDLSSDTTGDALHTGSTPGTRSGSGELSGGTCTLLNFTIGRRYRGGKPRIYLPWALSGDLLDPQTWSASWVAAVHTNFSTFVGAVLGDVSGSTTLTSHVNVSYYSGTTYPAVPAGTKQVPVPMRRAVPVVDDIIGFAVSSFPASQRRRNRT